MNKETAWYIYAKKADFYAIAERFNISPFLARIMVNRDIKEEDMAAYLNPDESCLHDGMLMKNVKEACVLLSSYIKNGEKIRVVGDYDIDGVCATYILVRALKDLGADISYEIPDRIKDGYGINENIIEEAKKDEIALIVTCDNGIAAFEAFRKAKEYGIKTIVTDHHDVRKDDKGDFLPEADYIINPKQEDCPYPFEGICGANVAYKFMLALYKYMKKPDESLKKLSEFVAIATIGDVMSLRDENRYTVKEGLKQIQNTENQGLRLLISECNLEEKKLEPFHIGFIIGPCLNAGGRLKSAKIALRLFLEEDRQKAADYAKALVELNEERKQLTLKGLKAALSKVESLYMNDKVLVIYLEDCHESLAGIIAGRIKENCNKPCIVLTDAHEGLIKGSARSIEAYNIFEKISEAGHLLTKYGGHPMAAGLSLKKENLDAFREFLNSHAKLSKEDFIQKEWIDIALPFSYITEDFINSLSLLEPFGVGNEKPGFASKNVRIFDIRVLGKERNVVKMRGQDEQNTVFPLLLFTDGDEFLQELGANEYIDIIYYPQINEYMGNRTLQLVIKSWKISKA